MRASLQRSSVCREFATSMLSVFCKIRLFYITEVTPIVGGESYNTWLKRVSIKNIHRIEKVCVNQTINILTCWVYSKKSKILLFFYWSGFSDIINPTTKLEHTLLKSKYVEPIIWL